MNRWTNYGDMRPLQHGGLFVQQEGKTTFRIIRVTPPHEIEENDYLVQDMYVDTSDSWIKHKDVARFADVSPDDRGVYMALALIDYYSPANFGCDVDEFVPPDDIMDHLEAYGIVLVDGKLA